MSLVKLRWQLTDVSVSSCEMASVWAEEHVPEVDTLKKKMPSHSNQWFQIYEYAWFGKMFVLFEFEEINLCIWILSVRLKGNRNSNRQDCSVPIKLVPLSLVVRRTFVSLPVLTGVDCAIAAVLVGASITTCKTTQTKKTTNNPQSQPNLPPQLIAHINHVRLSLK